MIRQLAQRWRLHRLNKRLERLMDKEGICPDMHIVFTGKVWTHETLF